MSELASLIWAISGLIGISSFAIYLWRRPNTSVRIKHNDSEIALTPTQEYPPLAKNDTPPPALNSGDQAEPEGLAEGQAAGTEVEQETRFAKAFRLLKAGEYDEGRELLEEEAKSEDSPEKRAALVAFGQHLAAVRGSTRALADLRENAAQNSSAFEVHFWLGVALRTLRHLDEAVIAFDAAFDVATTDDHRASALASRVNVIDDPARATEVVRFVLNKSTTLDRKSRSQVVARVAKLFLEQNPPDSDRAFALYEAAVDLDPSDNSLRFDVAHAYGEESGNAAAFIHYTRLIDRDAENNGALNNRGVAATNLGMETVAVRNYLAAEKLGNTLATANLSWKLINAGFTGEARSRLEPALSVPDAHRNVLDALGGVANAEKRDEETEASVLKRASFFREVLVAVGQSLMTETPPNSSIAGTYEEASTTMEITCSDSGMVAGTISDILEQKVFTGTLVGAAANITWSIKKRESGILLAALSTAKKGFGVLVPRGQLLQGYTYEGPKLVDPTHAPGYTEWRFRRTS